MIQIRLEQDCFKFHSNLPVSQQWEEPLYVPTLEMVHALLDHYYHQHHDGTYCVMCQGTQADHHQPPGSLVEIHQRGIDREHYSPGDRPI